MPAMNRLRGSLPYLLVFVVALVLRGVYLWQLRGSPMVGIVMGDAEAYDIWARGIAAGDWIGKDTFYQAPLYPYFLGLIYTVAGRSLLCVRLVQMLLGSLSCLLITRAGRDFFGAAAGLVAGLLLALNPSAIFFDELIQKTVLDLFFFSLLLVLVGRLVATVDARPPVSSAGEGLRPEAGRTPSAPAARSSGAKQHDPALSITGGGRPDRAGRSRPRVWGWLAIGAALGGFTLSRENALLLGAPLLLWLLLHFRRTPLRVRLAWTGAFLGGLLAVLAPVALRNLAVGGELHLTTAQLGPNLYIGNNEQSDGTYMSLRPGRGNARFERRDATELAEEALGRTLSPGEVSSYWTGRAFEYVRTHVFDWMRLMARKCFLVWNTGEIGDTEDQYSYADWSWLLAALTAVFPFGALVAFAVLGACLTWQERRRLSILYLLLLVYAASVAVFYVSARYRFPLVPVLTLFAAAGLVRGAALVREGSYRSLLPGAVVAAGIAIPANWPVAPVTEIKASTYFNLSSTMMESGNVDGAMDSYQRALRLMPDMPEAHVNLGVALYVQGRTQEAIVHLERAMTLAPHSAKALNDLGVMLARMGRFDEAQAQFRAALAIEPKSSSTYDNLGNALMKQGRLDDAVAAYLTALQLDPTNANAMVNLGRTLAGLGRLDEAVSRCREAIRLKPDLGSAHDVLSRALDRLGKTEEAAAEAREAARLKALPRQGRSEDTRPPDMTEKPHE